MVVSEGVVEGDVACSYLVRKERWASRRWGASPRLQSCRARSSRTQAMVGS